MVRRERSSSSAEGFQTVSGSLCPSSAALEILGNMLGPYMRRFNRPLTASMESRMASTSSRTRGMRHKRRFSGSSSP